MKKWISVLLSLSLLLCSFCVLPAKAGQSQTARTTEEYYRTEELEVSNYITTEGETVIRAAPKPTTTEAPYKDWLFAGWFTDASCDTVYTAQTGIAIAKFVPAEVLSAKCQILSGTSKENPSGKLRLISSVDSDRYRLVGFELTIDGITRSYASKEVYTRIVARENDVAFDYTPSVFSEASKYFITSTLKGIPTNKIQEGIRITPWWTTLDGTTVKGVGRYARVIDAYDQIVNVGVRLYSDTQVNSGSIKVGYDSTRFKFLNSDAGTVFDSVSAEDKGGYIEVEGSMRSSARNVANDGMFVNLRFQWIASSEPGGTWMFPVEEERFSNASGDTFSNFDIADIVCKYDMEMETLADVWGCSATFKVLQNVDNYESSKGNAQIALKVAKGEYEAQQIVISAKEDVSYNFSVSDLTSTEGYTLPAEQIDVFHEKYIEVETNYNGGVTGMYPDAIVPIKNAIARGETKVKSGDNQGIYVRFHIPNDQPKGVYSGTLQLWISGTVQDIPVTLQVMDVEVPKENHIKSVYFVYGGSWLGEQDGSQEMLNKYTETLYDYRLCSANIMLNNCHTDEDVQYYTDLAYSYMQNPACSFVLIPTVQLGNGIDKTLSKKYLEAFAEKSLKTGFNMLEKAGVHTTFLDEIDGFGFTDSEQKRVRQTSSDWTELCNEVADAIAADTSITSSIKAQVVASMRDCHNIVTNTSNDYVSTFKELGVTTLCPRFDNCTKDGIQNYDGMAEKWWYGCIYPRAPKPCYQLDIQSLTGIRAMGWMQADYGITGNLYWLTDLYSASTLIEGVTNQYGTVLLDDYYDTAERYPTSNGEGFLLYPGAAYGIDGPVASLRLEAIRDAFEEYELYCALENRCAAANCPIDMSVLTSQLYDDKVRVTAGDHTYAALREALLTAATMSPTQAKTYIQNFNVNTAVVTTDANVKRECAASSSSTPASTNTGQDVAVKGSTGGVASLLDFEEYNPDFQLIRVDSTFGKISRNSDMTYVRSGRYSAKVQPIGGYSSNSQASFYYPLYSQKAGFNYKDIRNWKEVTLWVWNSQSGQKELEISLVTTILNVSNYRTTETQRFVLSPGWNKITYIPDAAAVNVAYDAENVEGICFSFENAGVRNLADAPVYYMDDLLIHFDTEYKTCEDVLTFDSDTQKGVYEIIGFDKTFHEDSFTFDITGEKTIPWAKIVSASSEGISATQGSKVLKVNLRSGKADIGVKNKLIIPEKLVRESGFMNLSQTERSQYRFAFDVYVKNNNIDMTWEFYKKGLRVPYQPISSTRVSSGSWRTITFDFDTFEEACLTSPGEIQIAWPEYLESLDTQVLYLDNFRYEKIPSVSGESGKYTVEIKDSTEAFFLCNKLPANGKITLTYTVSSTTHNQETGNDSTGNNGLAAATETKKTEAYAYNSFKYSNSYNRVMRAGCTYTLTMWKDSNGKIAYEGSFTHPDGRMETLTAAHLNGNAGSGDANCKYFGICIFGSTTATLTNVTCKDETGKNLGLQVNQNNMGTCTIQQQ